MNSKIPAGIEKLDQVTEGYQIYQTLMAALDLGLFDLLAKEGPLDKEKIAQSIGINGMFSRCFLNTLVDVGVVSVQDRRYSNTAVASDFLISSSLFYQGDRLKRVKDGHWGDLVAALKRQQNEMKINKAGQNRPFLGSLAQGALRGELQAVTKAISNWEGFNKAQKLLDIGGGHGLYSIALLQANEHLNGVIFDQPHVIETAQQNIDRYNLETRLSTQSGDICTDSFGSGYDIVILSHVLYKFRKNLEPIFEKVSKCLNPGGLLVTNHWFCATGCVPESSNIKELSKSLQSFGHPLCHMDAFNELFKKKGFKIILTAAVPSAYDKSSLHLAVKQSECEETAEQDTCCCGCK